MSDDDVRDLVVAAKADTKVVRLRGREWRVTPFHCVVGPVDLGVFFGEVATIWREVAWPRAQGVHVYCMDVRPDVYVTDKKAYVERHREMYRDPCLFFTNDPLVVNEMRLGEVSLVVVDAGEVVLTNFVDLPDAEVALKIYKQGEWWLCAAEGGAEEALRFGRRSELEVESKKSGDREQEDDL